MTRPLTLTRRALLLPMGILAAACSRQPRAPSAQPPTQPQPPTPHVGDSNITITTGAAGAGTIAWRWDDKLPRFRDSAVISLDEEEIVFGRGSDDAAVVQRTRFTKKPTRQPPRAVWTHPLPRELEPGAALLLDGGQLFVALHSNISSGGILIALDLADGHERWQSPLAALGPVAHSGYQNTIQLAAIDGQTVVFGLESAGPYIEAFDPATGERLSSRRLKP